MPSPPRRWLALGLRVARLAGRPRQETAARVRQSYDRIAPGYDQAWTAHMRDLSVAFLDRLGDVRGAEAVDLCCGTGFVTGVLAARTGREVAGVDASPGMLALARARHPGCRFDEADAVAWLRARPPASADLVVSAWGLGYARPWSLVRAARRVLRPGGRLALLDNSLRSLSGVVAASVLAFAEQPQALVHVMRVGFLPGSAALAALLGAAGYRPQARWDGARSYRVRSGAEAVARLQATGAAAGFELACAPADAEDVFARFARILEERAGPAGVEIVHRYLGAVAVRP